jgi:hypothetical protein
MKNVILVFDVEESVYRIGISITELKKCPSVVSNNFVLLEESLSSTWGYEIGYLDDFYQYRCAYEDLDRSVILAQYVARLFPDSVEEKASDQKYEVINY